MNPIPNTKENKLRQFSGHLVESRIDECEDNIRKLKDELESYTAMLEEAKELGRYLDILNGGKS